MSSRTPRRQRVPWCCAPAARTRRLSCPFAGLSQLLRPALADALDLPIEHQRVLDRAVRIGVSPRPGDPLIAMAVLALLELLSRDQLLVLVQDDMQWIDQSSFEVLAFVGRRAADLRMATVAATRELTASPAPGTTVVELGPLPPADAQILLDAHATGLDPMLRQAILLKAEGNPLALVELPHALRGASAEAALADTLPVTTRIRESFANRLDQLPGSGRTLLLLAACLESGELAELAAAARALDVDLAQLDAAQRLDLIRLDDQVVRFTHPIIASVVVAQASPGELREAHRWLAQTLMHQPVRALRHRAAAETVADEALAADLESGAASLTAAAGSAAMAATLERAASLSVDPVAKARRLAAAADASRAAGRYRAAEALLARVDVSIADARTRLSVDSQRASHQFDGGNVDTALGMLVKVLEHGVELGRQETIRPAAIAGLARWLSGNRTYDADLRRLLQHLDQRADATTPALAVMALAAADTTSDPAGILAALFAAAAGASAHGASQLSTIATADTRAWELARLADAALVVDAIEPAQQLARLASETLRNLGSFGALATVLATQCHAEFSAGNWLAAAELAQEVLDIASVIGHRRQAAFVNATLAYIAAAQGRTEDAQRLRLQVVAWARPRNHRLMTALASWTQLLTALAGGEADLAAQAVSAMRPVRGHDSTEDGAADDGEVLVASACPDVVEALVRAGRVDEAQRVVRWVRARVQRWPSPTLAAQAANAQAVFTEFAGAPPDDIDAAYEQAIAAVEARNGFQQARVMLLYGAWLRRSRRPSQARPYLIRAEESFAAVGAVPWLDRARAELRASGQPRSVARAAEPPSITPPLRAAPAPGRRDDLIEELTAQEQLVVELAAEGLSNRQIGERLFLSPRTVGSHLYKAFPKLGVSNRAQLRAALDSTRAAPLTERAAFAGLSGELEPVDVDEVLAGSADKLEVDGMDSGDRRHVRRHRSPGLPRPGAGDREAADARAGRRVQMHLDQAADAVRSPGRHPGDELGQGRRAEVDSVIAQPVPVADPTDVLTAARVGRRLGRGAELGGESLGLYRCSGRRRAGGSRRRRRGGRRRRRRCRRRG